jgi:hypothetical protein
VARSCGLLFLQDWLEKSDLTTMLSQLTDHATMFPLLPLQGSQSQIHHSSFLNWRKHGGREVLTINQQKGELSTSRIKSNWKSDSPLDCKLLNVNTNVSSNNKR